MIIMTENEFIGVSDYMMKLCEKIWQSNSSKFHLLMNKGTSTHACCIKRLVKEEEVLEELNKVASSFSKSKKLFECRDFEIAWIDSFCSNTT